MPRAIRPASTRHADARRSVAITVAPVSRVGPRTIAVRPSTSMSAPMRASSGTCMNRFSKIVSDSTDCPRARVISTMNCACMSVGKPGNGCVDTSAGRNSALPRTRMPSPSATTSAPAARSLAMTASRCSGRQSRSSTLPPVIAPATSSVPASMRSGMTLCSIGVSSSTPSMVTSDVPAPRMRAPILLSTRPSSSTSGSRAAFSSVVRPRASAAAIIRFSVPVTVTMSNTMLAPRSRRARRGDVAARELDARAHRLQALEVLIDRTRADRAAAGQRHARAPVRATSGPSTSTDARIVLTSS